MNEYNLEKRLVEFKKEWDKKILSVEEINKKQLEEDVAFIYSSLGLRKPKFKYINSPLEIKYESIKGDKRKFYKDFLEKTMLKPEQKIDEIRKNGEISSETIADTMKETSEYFKNKYIEKITRKIANYIKLFRVDLTERDGNEVYSVSPYSIAYNISCLVFINQNIKEVLSETEQKLMTAWERVMNNSHILWYSKDKCVVSEKPKEYRKNESGEIKEVIYKKRAIEL